MIEEVIVWLVLIIGWASLLCVGGVIADAIERRLQDTDIDLNVEMKQWQKTRW
ncbi:MAG: hypothetical protein QF577_03545 [Phycisphaerae bacterium]|nr:hypothetical protein [Phycisphaerae bacterium]